ncbi:MAG: alginate export family protein [Proteobacteria bacterium]|nr:alginate export family protein [Pseudomonadota bacterium]
MAILLASVAVTSVYAAESFTEALTSGKSYVDFRLRFETVDQEDSLQDAEALTLRTRLGYATAEYVGFSAAIEFEDSRPVFGVDNFSVPASGFNTGIYSVVADPESTELDQAYIQYKANGFSGKIGRQLIILDNHRFVGDVGWRQDRQTFDGVTLSYQANDAINIKASHIVKRNRIFAEDQDIDSKDSWLNASYETGFGTLTGYAYLLEIDNSTDNSLDTYGLRFDGSRKVGENSFLYTAEFASQDANDTLKTDYLFLEVGVALSGLTAKVGLESLGSDNGEGAFSTPLATLHKFNGWADQFLGTPSAGVEDLYLTVSGKLVGGDWIATYHDFSTDIDAQRFNDLGNEINLQYTRKFGKNYYSGIKFAKYSAGDAIFGKVDTDKWWLWLGAGF